MGINDTVLDTPPAHGAAVTLAFPFVGTRPPTPSSFLLWALCTGCASHLCSASSQRAGVSLVPSKSRPLFASSDGGRRWPNVASCLLAYSSLARHPPIALSGPPASLLCRHPQPGALHAPLALIPTAIPFGKIPNPLAPCPGLFYGLISMPEQLTAPRPPFRSIFMDLQDTQQSWRFWPVVLNKSPFPLLTYLLRRLRFLPRILLQPATSCFTARTDGTTRKLTRTSLFLFPVFH